MLRIIIQNISRTLAGRGKKEKEETDDEVLQMLSLLNVNPARRFGPVSASARLFKRFQVSPASPWCSVELCLGAVGRHRGPVPQQVGRPGFRARGPQHTPSYLCLVFEQNTVLKGLLKLLDTC